MGHPTDIFTAKPADGCICPICQDVYKAAISLDCGHTFCEECIEMSLQSNDSCPNCRVEHSDNAPNYAVRDIVGSLQVCCTEQDDNGDGGTSSRKRQRGENGGNRAAPTAQPEACNWTGQLKDLDEHEKVCGFKTVTCSFDGCAHKCKRKDMDGHLSGAGMLMHMNLLKQSIERKYEERFEALEHRCRRLETNLLDQKYVNDCRSWVEYKPDALFDFKIYPIRVGSWIGKQNVITGLLCEIPGPLDSAWEGAKIPMVLRYPCGKLRTPPTCQFPAGFFHPNIYSSGIVCVSAFIQKAGWIDGTTLPEILFAIQQQLGHPNFGSPAQSAPIDVWVRDGIAGYNKRVKEEVESLYTGCVIDAAREKLEVEGERVDKLEAIEKAEQLGTVNLSTRTIPRERPAPPTFKMDAKDEMRNKPIHNSYANCKCSCCAWGQVFWDDKKRMRFLFG